MRASYAFVLQKNNAEVSTYSVLTPTFIIEPVFVYERYDKYLKYGRDVYQDSLTYYTQGLSGLNVSAVMNKQRNRFHENKKSPTGMPQTGCNSPGRAHTNRLLF